MNRRLRLSALPLALILGLALVGAPSLASAASSSVGTVSVFGGTLDPSGGVANIMYMCPQAVGTPVYVGRVMIDGDVAPIQQPSPGLECGTWTQGGFTLGSTAMRILVNYGALTGTTANVDVLDPNGSVIAEGAIPVASSSTSGQGSGTVGTSTSGGSGGGSGSGSSGTSGNGASHTSTPTTPAKTSLTPAPTTTSGKTSTTLTPQPKTTVTSPSPAPTLPATALVDARAHVLRVLSAELAIEQGQGSTVAVTQGKDASGKGKSASRSDRNWGGVLLHAGAVVLVGAVIFALCALIGAIIAFRRLMRRWG